MFKLLSNGKKYKWGFWRSVLYFFFASLDPLDGQHIKAESRSYKVFGSDKISREFYTFRAFLAYCRYMPLFWYKKKREEKRRRLARYWGVLEKVAFQVGAIAFNAVSNDQVLGEVTSETLSHTVGSGSNRAVFVTAGYADANASVSSATYAGDTMTSTVSFFASGANNVRIHILYKLTPTTGANDCVLNFSQATVAGQRGGFGVIDYTGVAQTSPIDVTGTNSSSPGVTTLDITLTTTVDNVWILNCVWWGGGGNLSVGQGETLRWVRDTDPLGEGGVASGGCDKATTTAGSYNTGWDSTSANSVGMGATTFKEAAAVTGALMMALAY